MSDIFFWSALTIALYFFGDWLYQRSRGMMIIHPFILVPLLMFGCIWLFGYAVGDVQQDLQYLQMGLGPVTVALAMPMYNQLPILKKMGMPVVLAIVSAGFIAAVLAWLAVIITAAALPLQMTMLTKSITTPLAMSAAEVIGGVPALAAVFVIITGIVGGVVSPLVYRICQVNDAPTQGLILGTVAHGVGTAKAIQMGEVTAAFASLGLSINGIVTAFVLSLLFA